MGENLSIREIFFPEMSDPTRSTSAAVTGLLARASQGDALATDELFPVVYDELRRLAAGFLADEAPGHTLQPTALVHEAFIRLVGPEETAWENRRHFFGAAARAIRRILIDHARARRREKRGADARKIPLDDAAEPMVPIDRDLIALDDALRRLTGLDAFKASVVELRFFGGLGMDEIADVLGASPSTVARAWRFAKAWLHRELLDEAPA